MRLWIVFCAFGLAALALAAQRSAIAVGGYAQEKEVATVNFDLVEGRPGFGTLLFASEGGHHDYPDTIISVDSFDRVQFSGRSVRASGTGTWHDHEAWVEIRAWDGAGTRQADRFSIRAVAVDGHVFEQEITLNVGDIAIRNR